jgi:hypothetical protein
MNIEVFILSKTSTLNKVNPKIELNTSILPIKEVSKNQWKELGKLQGRGATVYLRYRYGSPDTHVLLGYVNEKLAHVEWIVPDYKINKRYSFVTEGSYAIISCLTAPEFRGSSIYPSQIQEAVKSNITADKFWIWTTPSNKASLKGILKAGGKKVIEIVQRKWFWGFISRIEY